MPTSDTSELSRLAAYSGDPWTVANPYFAMAEAHMAKSWEAIWSFISDCDFKSVIDLAAGHGRNSEYLLKLCERLTILDIQPENIEACRDRFAAHRNVNYHANNGFDLQPVADASVTLVYCFDAMVHFDGDVVRSYLRDARRVLTAGGRGFFHHSNFTGGDDWRTNPDSRNFMSQEFFAHYARKEGLSVVRQRVIDWGNTPGLDCFTLVERPR